MCKLKATSSCTLPWDSYRKVTESGNVSVSEGTYSHSSDEIIIAQWLFIGLWAVILVMESEQNMDGDGTLHLIAMGLDIASAGNGWISQMVIVLSYEQSKYQVEYIDWRLCTFSYLYNTRVRGQARGLRVPTSLLYHLPLGKRALSPPPPRSVMVWNCINYQLHARIVYTSDGNRRSFHYRLLGAL